MAIILLVYSSLLIEARKVKLQIKRHEAATTVARTTGKRQIHLDANADTEEARAAKRAKRKVNAELSSSRLSCLYIPPFSPGVGLRGAPSEGKGETIRGEPYVATT